MRKEKKRAQEAEPAAGRQVVNSFVYPSLPAGERIGRRWHRSFGGAHFLCLIHHENFIDAKPILAPKQKVATAPPTAEAT